MTIDFREPGDGRILMNQLLISISKVMNMGCVSADTCCGIVRGSQWGILEQSREHSPDESFGHHTLTRLFNEMAESFSVREI